MNVTWLEKSIKLSTIFSALDEVYISEHLQIINRDDEKGLTDSDRRAF